MPKHVIQVATWKGSKTNLGINQRIKNKEQALDEREAVYRLFLLAQDEQHSACLRTCRHCEPPTIRGVLRALTGGTGCNSPRSHFSFNSILFPTYFLLLFSIPLPSLLSVVSFTLLPNVLFFFLLSSFLMHLLPSFCHFVIFASVYLSFLFFVHFLVCFFPSMFPTPFL